MNKKIKITALIIAAFTVFTFLGSCKKKPVEELPPAAVEIYDPDAGIDYSKEIVPLASGGVSSYKVVVAKNATAPELYAANELKDYTFKVTGAVLPLVTDDTVTNDTNQLILSIGKTKFFTNANLSVTSKISDSFIIKSVDKVIVLAGYRDRGTVYSVYDFLEKLLGIVFLSGTYDHVPQINTVKLYQFDIKETPVFEGRSHHLTNLPSNNAYMAKMRMIHPHQSIHGPARIGGGYKNDWLSDLHSFDAIVPFNDFYPTYGSDWFSMPDRGSYQPVLSSGLNDDGTIKDMNGDGVIDENDNSYLLQTIRNLKAIILERTDIINIMLGQMDNQNPSKHPDCLRQIELYGSYMGQFVVFTNAVAKAIEEWMTQEGMDRKIQFATFSYQYTFNAPVKVNSETGEVTPFHPLVVPRHNVYIMFAPITSSYNEPLVQEGSDSNTLSYTVMSQWSKITDKFMIFDYGIMFDAYLNWYPSMDSIVPNLLYYQEIGLNTIVTNSSQIGYYHADLYTWLFSKLYWNPNRDINELLETFNKYYFGEEAGAIISEFVYYMNSYFRVAAKDPVTGKVRRLGIYKALGQWLVSSDTLNYRFLKVCDDYIERAYAAVKNNDNYTAGLKEQYARNILTLEVQVMAMRYRNYDQVSYTDSLSKAIFMEKLMSTIRTLGLTETRF